MTQSEFDKIKWGKGLFAETLMWGKCKVVGANFEKSEVIVYSPALKGNANLGLNLVKSVTDE